MSISTELYGIDEETHERLIKELEAKAEGKNKKETLIRMVNELSETKRDQREIVVLAVMLGMIIRGR